MTENYTVGIKNYLERVIDAINSLDAEKISDAVNAITAAGDRGAAIWVMGNGGSAATASHFVCDFSKGVYSSPAGRRYDFRCLSDNTPIFTAIANDISYDDVFYLQLKDLLKPDDLVIAISGSGNSKNIIKAAEYTKSVGATLLGITGYDGGKLLPLSDFSLHVPVNDMQISEDVHMIFDHMIMKLLCEENN